jgi:hypothetical protein
MSDLIRDGQEDRPTGEKKGSQSGHIKTYEVNNVIRQSKKYLTICTSEIRTPSPEVHTLLIATECKPEMRLTEPLTKYIPAV